MAFIDYKYQYAYFSKGVEQEPFHDSNWTTKDIQYPWEAQPQVEHGRNVSVGPFWIDKDLVTREQY